MDLFLASGVQINQNVILMEILMGKCSRSQDVVKMKGRYDQESVLHGSIIVVDILQPKILSAFDLEKKKN